MTYKWFEYVEYQAGAGNIELARIVLEGLIERNPTYKKARELLESLQKETH